MPGRRRGALNAPRIPEIDERFSARDPNVGIGKPIVTIPHSSDCSFRAWRLPWPISTSPTRLRVGLSSYQAKYHANLHGEPGSIRKRCAVHRFCCRCRKELGIYRSDGGATGGSRRGRVHCIEIFTPGRRQCEYLPLEFPPNE